MAQPDRARRWCVFRQPSPAGRAALPARAASLRRQPENGGAGAFAVSSPLRRFPRNCCGAAHPSVARACESPARRPGAGDPSPGVLPVAWKAPLALSAGKADTVQRNRIGIPPPPVRAPGSPPPAAAGSLRLAARRAGDPRRTCTACGGRAGKKGGPFHRHVRKQLLTLRSGTIRGRRPAALQSFRAPSAPVRLAGFRTAWCSSCLLRRICRPVLTPTRGPDGRAR